jgi:tRNA 2-thiouridine synthesizing protein C
MPYTGSVAKNFAPTYRALGDYDVNRIYVEQESLQARGLTKDDLMPLTWEDEDDDWAEKDSIHVVSAAELADILEQQEVVFSF